MGSLEDGVDARVRGYLSSDGSLDAFEIVCAAVGALGVDGVKDLENEAFVGAERIRGRKYLIEPTPSPVGSPEDNLEVAFVGLGDRVVALAGDFEEAGNWRPGLVARLVHIGVKVV